MQEKYVLLALVQCPYLSAEIGKIANGKASSEELAKMEHAEIDFQCGTGFEQLRFERQRPKGIAQGTTVLLECCLKRRIGFIAHEFFLALGAVRARCDHVPRTPCRTGDARGLRRCRGGNANRRHVLMIAPPRRYDIHFNSLIAPILAGCRCADTASPVRKLSRFAR